MKCTVLTANPKERSELLKTQSNLIWVQACNARYFGKGTLAKEKHGETNQDLLVQKALAQGLSN